MSRCTEDPSRWRISQVLGYRLEYLGIIAGSADPLIVDRAAKPANRITAQVFEPVVVFDGETSRATSSSTLVDRTGATLGVV